MTNLKKLGLTALAGSLVATTGYAGSLDVSGAAKVSYNSGNNGAVNGNPFSMTRDITFSGSGEMDNGQTISYFQMLSAGGFSSSGLTLDMGDAGTMTFMNGSSGGHGISAYEDKMPSAAEQVWDDLDGQANGVLTGNKVNKIGYGTTVAGANVSVDYNKQQIDGATDEVLPLGNLRAKFEAFDWEVIDIKNGNDLDSILNGMKIAKDKTGNGKPVCVLLHTIMGNGVNFMMHTNAWHGKAPNDEQLEEALKQNPVILGDY